PKANRPYWEAKIARNRARDAEHRAALEAMGWRAVTLWECELKDEDPVERQLKEELAGDRGRI
ncbi:MAG: very short patch repair endonuclease, partial [Caulobacteraceae bacterium]